MLLRTAYLGLCTGHLVWCVQTLLVILFGMTALFFLKYSFWVQDDGILVIPTTAHLPPKLGGKDMLSEDYQILLFSLLSIASLSGCCQVKCFFTFSGTDPNDIFPITQTFGVENKPSFVVFL